MEIFQDLGKTIERVARQVGENPKKYGSRQVKHRDI